MGRAKATAAPSLKALGKEAITFDWLQEFKYNTKLPRNYPDKKLAGKDVMCWDLEPEFYTSDKKFFDKDKWTDSTFMKAGNIKKPYKMVCDGIDGLLAEYGYIRNKKNFYDVKSPVPNHNWNEPLFRYHLKSVKDDYPEETTLVFFCHLGVMFTIIAHLTGLSPMQLWQGFYVAPTSITVLNSEERFKGQAWFRVERLGDTNHLTNGGERISSSGYFADVLQENI
jgi:probable phosphoglycerate mutase